MRERSAPSHHESATRPPGIRTRDIYTGIIPFVGMQILALVLVFLFPGLATWLPQAIGW